MRTYHPYFVTCKLHATTAMDGHGSTCSDSRVTACPTQLGTMRQISSHFNLCTAATLTTLIKYYGHARHCTLKLSEGWTATGHG